MKRNFFKTLPITTVSIVLFLLVAGCNTASSTLNPLSADGSLFDATVVERTGVAVFENFEAKPDKGILKTIDITLPAYKSVLYFSTDSREKFLDAANRIFPWVADDLKTIVSDNFRPDPKAQEPSRNGILALFKLENNEYLLLQGMASPDAMSHFMISDNGTLQIKLVTFGNESVSGDIPLVAYARGKNLYDVFQQAWKSAINTKALEGRTAMRYEKEYPEMFNYLGWCSWEQYRRKITSDLMLDAMKKIEKSPLPIRWVMVDDGHQHQTGSTMEDSRLLSFKAHPQNFPQGFKPLMDLKSDKIKWMGIWHAMNGQWQGLNPEHEMRELDPYLIKITKKSKGEPMDVMMPKGDSISSWMFYKSLIGSTKEHGFDFVKIDNQNRQIAFYNGLDNPVKTVAQHAQSLERAAHEFSGGLINCFCADLLSLMNTKYSAVSRVSVDYLLNNEEKAKSHLFQSYQNTLWMGQAVWPDHDMFHSSDMFCGRMMAVSKAMSGAPIYLSDAPDDFLEELVNPLCYSSGRLLRPLAPAIPLPESATLSALSTAQAYRVVAPLPHGAAAFVVYNLTHPTPVESVKTQISAEDYKYAGSFIQPSVEPWNMPEEGLVYYDWYAGKGGLLTDSYEIVLNGFSDRFVQLSPLIKGWSVIGCTDKYLSAAAIEEIDYNENVLKVKLVESGTLLVYNESPISCDGAQKIESIGNGLWKINFPSGKPGLEVNIKTIE
jgi:Raffinose synthase or seed imbibition protein Sip1